jgi:hypothetical protein
LPSPLQTIGRNSHVTTSLLSHYKNTTAKHGQIYASSNQEERTEGDEWEMRDTYRILVRKPEEKDHQINLFGDQRIAFK